MRISGGRLRFGLFAVLFVLLCINALALWGEPAAHSIFTALQAITGLAGIVCAVVVARRKQGRATAWRLLVVAAFVSSLVGDLLWYAGRDDTPAARHRRLRWRMYFLPPLLTLMIAVLLVRTGGPVRDGRDGSGAKFAGHHGLRRTGGGDLVHVACLDFRLRRSHRRCAAPVRRTRPCWSSTRCSNSSWWLPRR